MPDRFTGSVVFFDDRKGWGFVRLPNGGDLFVHYSQVLMAGRKTLIAGQQVEFQIGKRPNSEKAQAEAVLPLESENDNGNAKDSVHKHVGKCG
jgi:cold shock protein